MTNNKPVIKRKFSGVVVSDKMLKTRVVLVTRTVKHPRYEKIFMRSKRLKVHDEENMSHVGDSVTIEETRPISREKRWKITKIIPSSKKNDEQGENKSE